MDAPRSTDPAPAASPEAVATAPAPDGGESQRSLRFLVRSASALALTTALTSGLGFVYWTLSARLFPAAQVGEAATAISAMTLLATAATLGYGTLLIGELPGMRSRRSDFVATAAAASGLAGGLLALLAALVLPAGLLGLPGTGSSPTTTLLFAAGVSATAVGLVLDSGLLSMLGGGPQLGRNAVLSVSKLVLLGVLAAVVAQASALEIYTSWLLGNLLSIAVLVGWVALRHRVRLGRVRLAPRMLHGVRRSAAQHHALNLGLSTPFFAMPVVANAVLGSEEAGYLYAAWSVAAFVMVLPLSLSTSLFASGARSTQGFVAQFRFTLRTSTVACVATNLVLLVAGGLVLGLFGAAYADSGRVPLVLVCLGAIPLLVKDHHVSVARVTGRVGPESALIWGLTALELGGAITGAHLGGLEGLVCLPLVVRALRGRVPGLT